MDNVEAKVMASYTKHAKVAQAQVGPAIISTIIELIMSILGSCMKNKTAKDIKTDINKKPVLVRIAVRRAMRQSGMMNRADTDEIVETVISCGEDATETEIYDLHNKSRDFIIN